MTPADQPGTLWYVDPVSGWRMPLTSPGGLSTLIGKVGIKVHTADLAKIPVAGSKSAGNAAQRAAWAGRFLRDQDHGMRAWYVTPISKVRYELPNPTAGFATLKGFSRTITPTQFAALGHNLGIAEISKNVVTSSGTFAVTMLSFDRTTPGLKIMTDTAELKDCANNCAAFPLATMITQFHAQAGIHGAYACPPDYAACAGKVESYFAPIYNSFARIMINDQRIRYTTQPMVAFDTNNVPYYFHDSRTFKNQATFEATYGVKLRAAMSNGPATVEAGKSVLLANSMDTKQATAHGYRGFLAWKGNTMMLGVVKGATVPDETKVLVTMGVDYALNLDGGGTTALYHGGRYLLGPGRLLTNAILITN